MNTIQNMENNENIDATESKAGKLSILSQAMEKIKSQMGKYLVGQEELVELMLVALFCKGHVLIEGVPGVAKTMAARLMASSLDLDFGRIQFTPDLMPSDITGTNIFNVKTSEFNFKRGPIFGNIILIDEINRSPAKTQAALFEVMEEGQVTSDGETHALPQPFMILATQNPIEQEGTYKLPEAQQDRFMMKIIVSYPNADEEYEILNRFYFQNAIQKMKEMVAIVKPQDIANIRELIDGVSMEPSLLKYIAGVIVSTRNHKDLFLGASPRASLAIMRASKAIAAMRGRSFVTPDDIKYVTFSVLNHRLILTAESEMAGTDLSDVINDILKTVEVPR